MRTREEQLSAMARVGDREDIAQWQRDQKEFFDPCILSIVEEYAVWRDKKEAECAADTRRLEWLVNHSIRIENGFGEPCPRTVLDSCDDILARSVGDFRPAIDAAMEGGK